MKIAIALLTTLLSTAGVADGTSGHTCNTTDTCMHVGTRADRCPTEAVLLDGGCMDSDILATQLEYLMDLSLACTSNDPAMDRNAVILEAGILYNLSKFVPPVGFNDLTLKEVAAIQDETDRIVPQYAAMIEVLNAHVCN